MRILVLAAALALCCVGSAAAAAAEDARARRSSPATRRRSARAISPNACAAAADTPTAELRAAVDAAIKSIDARQGLLSSQKARWRRSLSEAQAQWTSWRDSECQDVAPFEAGMAAKGGDPRLELHHRLRRRARREPQGALSLSAADAELPGAPRSEWRLR